MNRKIIYVDFIFKKKRITSRPLLFLYIIKLKLSFFLKNLSLLYTKDSFKTNKNNKPYNSNKVSSK